MVTASQLVVQLTDMNDNAPEFSSSLETVSIQESWEPGRIVTVVAAQDRDQGSNAALSYSISQGNTGGQI